MARFFSADNEWFSPLGYVADVVLLSGLWFLCSIPVVTAGAATTALYDTTARCVRGHDRDMFGRFFRTFRREFLPSLLASVLWGALLWGGFSLVKLYGNSVEATRGTALITVALLFLLTVAVGIFSWVLPLQSRFTFSFGGLQVTAVKLALGNILRTVALGIVTVACGWLCVRYVFPVFVVPEIMALLWTVFEEPVFRRYMPEDLADTRQED